MDYTFLRDNFYLDFLPLLAGEDGVIRGPAGDGVVAAVARATYCAPPSRYSGTRPCMWARTYDLTGPEDISLARAAELLTAGTGRTITFRNETLEEAYASRASYGAPPWQVDAWVSTYTAIAAGDLAGPTSAGARTYRAGAVEPGSNSLPSPTPSRLAKPLPGGLAQS